MKFDEIKRTFRNLKNYDPGNGAFLFNIIHLAAALVAILIFIVVSVMHWFSG